MSNPYPDHTNVAESLYGLLPDADKALADAHQYFDCSAHDISIEAMAGGNKGMQAFERQQRNTYYTEQGATRAEQGQAAAPGQLAEDAGAQQARTGTQTGPGTTRHPRSPAPVKAKKAKTGGSGKKGKKGAG